MPVRVGLKTQASDSCMDRDYTTDYPLKHLLGFTEAQPSTVIERLNKTCHSQES